jgi:large subunit ribosomal protein L29
MKIASLREMTKDELLQKERELREALFNLRFQHATGQLENHAQIRRTRRGIAQVLTMLREHEAKAMAKGQ